MPDLNSTLVARLQAATAAAFGAEHASIDPLIRPANNPKNGDFQANLAMALAKKLGQPPREVAAAIVAELDRSDLLADVTLGGPGFINLTVNAAVLADHAAAMLGDAQGGVPRADATQTVVVDYSSPNVAKEMHVGHLRSTVIGDAVVRTLEAVGHTVIRQNHLGDWGTQFGMLIELILDAGFELSKGLASHVDAGELTKLYKQAKQKFDADSDFADRARHRVVLLQQRDPETIDVWSTLVERSKDYFDSVYARMGVRLARDDVRGESFYNDRLAGVVERLEAGGELRESQGARVVFPRGFTDRDGEPLPMIVQKSDGGYLYATTDLAAAVFRVDELNADRVVYVIGLPQRQHFEMFSTTLRQCGWIGADVRLDYVGFGSVLGADKKMFKTRSGETVRLVDLLDEAEKRAAAAIAEKNPDLPADEAAEVARAVGMGALKYADLSGDRVKDYVFDWDRMLGLDGNTAPYLLYSYARIRSIFRKGEIDFDAFAGGGIVVDDPAERGLVLQLLQFGSTVESVAESLEPHRLCNYLYELATRYHRFFEACPVLKSDDETKAGRLALCKLTALTLKRGLRLLGIDVVERM